FTLTCNALLSASRFPPALRSDGRGRFLCPPDRGDGRHPDQAAAVGHGRPGAVSLDHQIVLPELGRRAARVRHHQPRQLRAHPAVDDGGEAAHRAAPARVCAGRLQARSRHERGAAARGQHRGGAHVRRAARADLRGDVRPVRHERAGGVHARHAGGVQPDQERRVQGRGRLGRHQEGLHAAEQSRLQPGGGRIRPKYLLL
uniref:Uncharacterized protein n=1 Tax=Anopheles melas TaxID=34690 RepID=A0A182TID7_9DIPT